MDDARRDSGVPETVRVHKVILRPRFGWTAGVVVTTGVLCLLAGAGFVVALVSTDVPVDPLAVVLAVLALGFGATAMPLLLIGRTGRLHLDAEGLRIEHPALLRRPWDLPGTSIRFARYAPPRFSGRWTLGLAPSHDRIEIRFREPFPTMPIRYRFLIYAAVTASGAPATLPVPGVRIEALTIRVDLDFTDRYFLDRLTFPSETRTATAVD
ncbi:hypothetical protein [Allobranchiibius sp. CTAmp26]|uniref:hypothetical protein n=1 Tax=Allobranchiibius sp. CTAmp26 TaxID=2815214 RepID=UPI001AA0C7CF|nr:hypothetical protein [Allobranchiibius sp. CTAmp26]MBO1754930.1 hypothetical protein [Allobranchiibius sp. CTAmp26]